MGKHSAVPADSAAETGRDMEDEIGSPTVRTAETLLRILPMALCVAALVIMLKDSQTNDYGSLSYSDLGAFRYTYISLCINTLICSLKIPSSLQSSCLSVCIDI